MNPARTDASWQRHEHVRLYCLLTTDESGSIMRRPRRCVEANEKGLRQVVAFVDLRREVLRNGQAK